MLLTEWNEAGAGMTSRGPSGRRCAMEHQGSFVRAVRDGYHFFFPFPRFDGRAAATGVEVSVDVAGLFSAKPQAHQLLIYLASRDGQQEWIKNSRGAFFSPRTDTDRAALYGGNTVSFRIAEQLATTARNRCLDASDFMSQTVASAFSGAVLEFLTAPDRLPDILTRLDAVPRSVDASEWLPDPCPAWG